MILSRADKCNNKYHYSCINLPYFKYNTKNSKYSEITKDIFQGNPNIYASFMGMVSNSLEEEGQMVSITPRSFTNGLYFKHFRKYLINNLSIDKIHIFSARDKVFKNMKVLQENIICLFSKGEQK